MTFLSAVEPVFPNESPFTPSAAPRRSAPRPSRGGQASLLYLPLFGVHRVAGYGRERGYVCVTTGRVRVTSSLRKEHRAVLREIYDSLCTHDLGLLARTESMHVRRHRGLIDGK